MNSLQPRRLYTKFGWNWPIGSGEGFEKSSIYFHYLLPLRKVWSLRLNKREPPLSMNYLCKMLKVAQWFLRRRFSDVVNVFMLRLWKRTWPFEESRIPFTVLSIQNSSFLVVLAKKSMQLSMHFHFFLYIYLQSKQMWPFIWNPFNHRCCVPSLVEIGPVVLWRKILKCRQCSFCYFAIIYPWKRAQPFI